jgi:hypothetical protein
MLEVDALTATAMGSSVTVAVVVLVGSFTLAAVTVAVVTVLITVVGEL